MKRRRISALLLAGLLVFQNMPVRAEELFVSGISEAEESTAGLTTAEDEASDVDAAGGNAGEEIIDAGVSDGEASDGETSEEGTADGETSDGETSDGETSDGETSDGETFDGETSDGGTSDGETSDGGTSDGEASAEGISDGAISDGGEDAADVFSDAEETSDAEEIVFDSEEYSTDAGFLVDDAIFEEYGISLLSDDEAFSDSYGASSEIYSGTYGAQLEGFNDNDYALQCYDLFVEKLTTDWSSAAEQTKFSMTLETAISFEGEVTEPSSGSTEIVKDDNYNTAVKPLKEAVSAAWSAFLYDYPEAFWMNKVSFSYNMSFIRESSDSTSATITVKGITFSPKTIYDDDTQSVINTFQANVAAAVEELTAETEGATRYETVKAIHDYVCENAYYDSSGVITSGTGTDAQYQTHCAGPIFADDGGVVCEGYAKAMKILCDRMEISCACVVGKASTTGGTGDAHMWNYIQMENESWYLTDATWDDSTSGSIGEIYLLAGSDSNGKNVKISQERTNSATFYTLSGYTVMNFTYPTLSVNSYLDDTTETTTTETATEASTEVTTEDGAATATEADSAQTETEATVTATVMTESETEITTAASKTPTGTEASTSAATKTPTGTEASTSAATETPTNTEASTETTTETPGTTGTTEKTATTGTAAAAGTSAEASDDTVTEVLTPTITISATSFPLKVKQSYTVKVSGLAAGDAVKSWKSNKPKVASVNKNGKITGKKAGTAKITVTLKSGLSSTITVKVQTTAVKTTKIKVSAKKLTLKRGQTFKLAATVTPVTSKQKVTYTSSNKKTATVSSSGKITAKKKGTAVITVKSGTKKVKVKVTVE